MDGIELGKQRLYKRKHCYRKACFLFGKKQKIPPGNEPDFFGNQRYNLCRSIPAFQEIAFLSFCHINQFSVMQFYFAGMIALDKFSVDKMGAVDAEERLTPFGRRSLGEGGLKPMKHFGHY